VNGKRDCIKYGTPSAPSAYPQAGVSSLSPLYRWIYYFSIDNLSINGKAQQFHGFYRGPVCDTQNAL